MGGRGGMKVDTGTDGADDDALADFRKHVLDSDSEDESDPSDEDDDDALAHYDSGSAGRRDPIPGTQQGFNWSMLGDEGEGAVVASAPTRQLLNRRTSSDDADYRQDSRRSSRHVGSRKGQGVEAVSRARSGRNYSEPDDDLLPM